ncbi:MAG: GHMP kinase [Verrucomicrobiae bacterium]|nr:GHMP kinase [Verrucomicrobiae bacterium]
MIITQTPLRVSLAGGGTDIPQYYTRHGGEVLGLGIDKYLFVWIKERFDRQIIVNWTRKEVVSQLDEIQHELVREAARMADLAHGFEVTTLADIPSEGSGLGSSSALTVCLLNAFFQHQGMQLSNAELAQRACDIELRVLGKPMGKQDQYLAAFGGLQHLFFHPDETVTRETVKTTPDALRQLNHNLLLYYTGITRKASAPLKVQIDGMEKLFPLYHQIKQMAGRMRKVIEAGQMDEVGVLLHEAWEIKRQFAAVTMPEIDRMYETARQNGASGGKLCGAGGGGFLLVYCPLHEQERLRRAMSAYPEMPFEIDRIGTRAILNVQRRMWKIR